MHFDQFLKEVCPQLDLNWRKYRRRAARHNINVRLLELGLSGLEAYKERLLHDQAEAESLANRMRITVSRFYRDRSCWDDLRLLVLPELIDTTGLERPLRIWSAGCCSGEEPYTLALLWREYFTDLPADIYATDIDTNCIERAHRATYGPSSLRELPKVLRQTYFNKLNNLWQLSDEIKGTVHFELRDLLQTVFSRTLDLICCRYLIFTYYSGPRRLKAAWHLWQALRPGGALMIGDKEFLGLPSGLFEPWPGTEGIFRKCQEDSKVFVRRKK